VHVAFYIVDAEFDRVAKASERIFWEDAGGAPVAYYIYHSGLLIVVSW
jgi:hypothetical protein